MSKGKRIFLTVGGVAVVIAVIVLLIKLFGGETDFSEKYAGVDLENATGAFEREGTYASYLEDHKDAPNPQSGDVVVDLTAFTGNSTETEIRNDFQGEPKVLFQGEGGYTEWKVNIPETGMYHAYIEYFPVQSRGIGMERGFLINGEVPFTGSDALTFTRRWADEGPVVTDNQGNDRRPTQVEIPEWSTAYFKDYMGYYTEPFEYFFEAGENTIALDCINEPMAIRKIVLEPVKEAITYADYTAAAPKVAGGQTYSTVVQGEASIARSEQSLYSRSDHASANTEPYSVKQVKLNYAGGEQWKVAGQWIEWEFEVPADGYYNITIKGRQSYIRGRVSNRAVYIDGKVPFEELNAVPFAYTTDWQNVTLGDENGTPYNIFLEAGKHTIRLEVALGDLGDILNDLQDSVMRLNDMYRTILVLTGATPDPNRDYNLDKQFPEVISAMDLEYRRLYKIIDDYVDYAGELGGDISTVQKLAVQLEKFMKKTEKISKQFTTFKSNVSGVGTSINNMSEAPLDIDLITITGVDTKPEPVKTSFFANLAHEVRSFVASFTVDYEALGNVYEEGEAITVWLVWGRDQGTVLKSLVDDVFTPKTGIPVNIKIVPMEQMVLNATLAGNGPDVAIYMGQGSPVDYALRDAAVPLNQFSGWEKLVEQYPASSMAPFWFDGNLYGLPLTHVYNVMFYRTDILGELGVAAPDTWDQLIDMLPTLQQNNLEVAIPSTERKFGNTASPDLSSFVALLYQNGGTMYSDDLTMCTIASEAGVKAFETYTRFYSHYGLPFAYDFANRFRSGEMPIGIQDYDTYNTIAVLAPEIRGLWDFVLIPGTEQEDGSIDRSVNSWGYANMILKNDKRSAQMTENCWKFLKWWGDSETQARFGREVEAVLGAASRYQTANKVAFEQLPWSADQMAVLKEQWSWTKEVPTIPGGYYVTRHITNAARKVYNESQDPRETLLDYVDTINDEIEKKRKEFGLPVASDVAEAAAANN